MHQILLARACSLGSQHRTTGLLHVRKCLFSCVTHHQSCEKRGCLNNGVGTTQSHSLGLMPRHSVQLLLGASEESKTGKTYEVIFLCPGARKLLPLLFLPSSIYLLGDSESNTLFSFSPILYSVVPLAGVLGRAVCSFLVLGLIAIDELVNMLVKSSIGKKARMQQNIAALPSLPLTSNTHKHLKCTLVQFST